MLEQAAAGSDQQSAQMGPKIRQEISRDREKNQQYADDEEFYNSVRETKKAADAESALDRKSRTWMRGVERKDGKAGLECSYLQRSNMLQFNTVPLLHVFQLPRTVQTKTNKATIVLGDGGERRC